MSGWEGRGLSTTTRRTGSEGREGGTWGQTSSLSSSGSGSVYLPAHEEHSVATVHLPPEIGPAILPFWTTTPGASSSSSPGTSSSSTTNKESKVTSTIPVQKIIKSIEEASKPREEAEENSNFKEAKKKEDPRRRTNHEEEEDPKLDLKVKTLRSAYLQGSGPQTGQGRAPASSSSESLGSIRSSSSSSAGPAKGSGCLHVWQVQE